MEIKEENKNKIDEFATELGFITDTGIREVTETAICYISPYFFEVAASSTGHHHPIYGQGRRGLLRHTRAAVNIAQLLREINYLRLSDYDLDIAIAALILHDSCKRGVKFEEQNTVHEHPLLVEYLVPRGTFTNRSLFIWKDICAVISTHMGKWNTNKYSDIILPNPLTSVQKFVSECDYLAAKKIIEISNIWNEEDKEIISMNKTDVNIPDEPMTEKQERYIRKLLEDYRTTCNRLAVPCESGYLSDDLSNLNKKSAGSFIGKLKRSVQLNNQILTSKK